jgi:uncharacterized membrane protein YoaK (UPF0700 family)
LAAASLTVNAGFLGVVGYTGFNQTLITRQLTVYQPTYHAGR